MVDGGTAMVAGVPVTVSEFALDEDEVSVGRFREFVTSYAGPPDAGSGSNPNSPGDLGWDPTWNVSTPQTSPALVASLQCDPFATWSDSPASWCRC